VAISLSKDLQGLNSLLKKSERKANPTKDGLAGAKQVAEKGIHGGSILEKHPSGAKAPFILLAFSARLKPCPDTKPHAVSFSASCKAPFILLAFSARLKPCPDTKPLG
jgi:hypothetical protein